MSEVTSETVLGLISLVGDGDMEAADSLLKRYRPYLRIIAQRAMRQMFRTKFDESDIVQQTCLDAFNGISSFRGETSAEFSGWISKILHRNLTTLVRNHTAKKRDVRRELPLLTPAGEASLEWYVPTTTSNGPVSVFLQGELALVLAKAMSKLSEDQRTAVQLRFLEGLKIREIADEMDMSTPVVARLITGGIDTLRRNLPKGFDRLG